MEIEIKTGKCSMIQKDNKKYDFGAYAELVSWWAENLITQEDKDTFLADFQWNNLLSILRMDGGCHSFNYTIRQSDFHHSFSIVCRLFPQEYDNQEEYIYAYTVDVSQFKEQELRNRQLVDISQKLLNISLTESLTGLYNRTAAEKFITEHIERCIREETGTLLLLDIDRFKDFNDKFGHQVGDFVLKYLSKSMQDIFRSDDILCRWGGDEFMIYMRDVSQRKNVESRVHRLRLRMQQCSHNEIPLNVTMSIGATTVKKGMTLDQLFAQCDKMLYQVKEKGRDGLMIYND